MLDLADFSIMLLLVNNIEYQMINVLRKFNVEPQAIEQPLDLEIPENKIMLALYLAAPEVENDRRALNVRNGMRRAVKEGRYMGQAPVGYSNKVTEDGQKYIAPHEPDASIMKWAFEKVAEDKCFVSDVFRQAKVKGLSCGKSQFWNLLRNPAYCGKIFLRGYKDEPDRVLPGRHQPIISDSLFYRVQDILDGKKKTYQLKVGFREELLLRGHLICPECGKILTGSGSKGRSRKYFYYHCLYPCKVRIKSKQAHNALLEEFKRFNLTTEEALGFTPIIDRAYKTSCLSNQDEMSTLNGKLDELKQAIHNAMGKFVTDEIDRSEYEAFKQQYKQEMDMIENRIIMLSKAIKSIDALLKKGLGNLTNLVQNYELGNVYQKRKIIGSIFPEKMVFDGENYRTAKLNEVISLLLNLGADFRQKKTGKNDSKIKFSSSVARPGFEPRHTEPKSVVLPLYYRAIRSFFSEWGAKIGEGGTCSKFLTTIKRILAMIKWILTTIKRILARNGWMGCRIFTDFRGRWLKADS
jgi:site-specific DNA recombinase